MIAMWPVVFIELFAELDELVMLFIDVAILNLGLVDEAGAETADHRLAYILHDNHKLYYSQSPSKIVLVIYENQLDRKELKRQM
jgi:hypothetical protein